MKDDLDSFIEDAYQHADQALESEATLGDMMRHAQPKRKPITKYIKWAIIMFKQYLVTNPVPSPYNTLTNENSSCININTACDSENPLT